MIITVELKRRGNNPVRGIIQIGDQAKDTIGGKASFDITEGQYTIRGLAMGYHFESKIIQVVGDAEVVIEAR